MKETNMGLVDDNDTSMGCSGVKDIKLWWLQEVLEAWQGLGMREKSVTLFQKSVLRGAWEQDNQSNAHGVQFQFQYRRRRSVRRTSSTTYASD